MDLKIVNQEQHVEEEISLSQSDSTSRKGPEGHRISFDETNRMNKRESKASIKASILDSNSTLTKAIKPRRELKSALPKLKNPSNTSPTNAFQ